MRYATVLLAVVWVTGGIGGVAQADGGPAVPKVDKVANFPVKGIDHIFCLPLLGQKAWLVQKKEADGSHTLYFLSYDPASAAPWAVGSKPILKDPSFVRDVAVCDGRLWLQTLHALYVGREARPDQLALAPDPFFAIGTQGPRPHPYRMTVIGGKLHVFASDGLYRLDATGWRCLAKEKVERPEAVLLEDTYTGDVLLNAKLAPEVPEEPYGAWYRYRKDQNWAKELIRATDPGWTRAFGRVYPTGPSGVSYRIYHGRAAPWNRLQSSTDGKTWTFVEDVPEAFRSSLLYIDQVPGLGMLLAASSGRLTARLSGGESWTCFTVPKREGAGEALWPVQGPDTSILVLKTRYGSGECELYQVSFGGKR